MRIRVGFIWKEEFASNSVCVCACMCVCEKIVITEEEACVPPEGAQRALGMEERTVWWDPEPPVQVSEVEPSCCVSGWLS